MITLYILFVPLRMFISQNGQLYDEPLTAEKKLMIVYGKEAVKRYIDPQLFSNNHILAYYGHPKSKIMGIVGRKTKEELVELLEKRAAVYDKLNGPKGVVPAFYLIYGTCQPEGNIYTMNKKLLESYIKFALKHKYLVYLDHQIGKYKLETVMKKMLPFLKYPNVHIAVDCEWRTKRPMKEIGFLLGKELNQMQAMMARYIKKHEILGQKQLVFHQFNYKMLRKSKVIKSNYKQVILVHTTSGWGGPKGKRSTHKRNSKVTTIPYKGFKLWLFYSNKKGVHYDSPLMPEIDVLQLNPQPGLIIYQ